MTTTHGPPHPWAKQPRAVWRLTIARPQAEKGGCTAHSALYTAGSSLFTVGCVVWLASAVRTSRAAAQRAAGEKKADASA